MTSVLYCQLPQSTAPGLSADLIAAGLEVMGKVEDCNKLVQSVVLCAPDVVICDVPQFSNAWFQALKRLEQALPCPLIVFTHDTDASRMQKAVECGVLVYVVNGYGAHRLRPLVHLAQARFQHSEQQREAYEAIATRLEERKSIDRAKGILMHAQRLSDDDAFSALRSAAMRSKQRLGQLSQHIIQSASLAEAVNRSGQLRMLSQRVVKLHLLQAAGVHVAQHTTLLQESLARVDANLSFLRKSVSQPTYGDLLSHVSEAWGELKVALAHSHVPAMEQQAEALLMGAERLTSSLERSGAGAPLNVLNMAGRQRMLAQRFCKYALLCQTVGPAQAESALASMRAAQSEFEEALTYLNGIPLSTPDIHQTLAAAGVAWVEMVAASRALARPGSVQGDVPMALLAERSEVLLGLFEQLATHYAHSMQMLLD